MELHPTETASEIFETHFQRILDPDAYTRARTVFDEAGAYNERSMAIQIQTALHFDKFEEVLGAYEELLAMPEFQDLDFISRSVSLKRFADHVYGQIIAEGDPMHLLTRRLPAEILDIFDRMS